MIKLGEYNTLTAFRTTDNGVYLIDKIDRQDEVLLPKSFVPETLEMGDDIEVFIYTDSEDRPVATTLQPKLTLNNFGVLEVKQIVKFGAFLDWGLAKDLLVPLSQQMVAMEEGKKYPVFLYLDYQTDRLAASSKVDQYLEKEDISFEENQEVDLIIYKETDLGYNAIIDNKYGGLLYKSELIQPIQIGDQMKGFVKKMREDGKVDLSLYKQGFEQVDSSAQKIIDLLKSNGGNSSLNDKSAPEDIFEALQISKKSFKKAAGLLYKKRIISIDKNGMKLLKMN